MPLRRISPELKTLIACGMAIFTLPLSVNAAPQQVQQIGGVVIPQAFSQALQDGMSIPLFLHLEGSAGTQDDQRLGSAFIWLDAGTLRVRHIQLEERGDNASVSEQTRKTLTELANEPFNSDLHIALTRDAQLQLSLRQLLLQLVVKREALGTVLRSRSEDIGQSSVNSISSSLNYNLGVYNNQMRNAGNSTSSYLSLNSVSSLREHHIVLDGSLYGTGTSNQDSEIYKAMYERDFAGHRFAGGMLDTWNLQSLGPMTAISAGKIYGASWGNQASSTVFDNSQSVTPIVAFLPAAGEVHLSRDGRLLSVQNFVMGNHEVDTRGLPYGIYDVDVEVIVGHFNIVLGEGVPQLLIDGVVGGPVVLHGAPAVNGVFDGACAVVGKVHRRGRVRQDVGGGFHGLHTSGHDGFRRCVIGGSDGPDDPASAQNGIIDDLGGGEVLVGHQDHLAVRGLQLGVVQADLADSAGNAAGFNEISLCKGTGGEDHQSAGHIAENILRRQRDAQGEDGQQRRQGGGVEAQGLGGDDDRQDVQQGFHGGEDQLLQPVVDLLHPIYQPGRDLHDEPDCNQADQQRYQRGENLAETVAAQRCAQRCAEHRRKTTHNNMCLLIVRPCGLLR